eukprot:08911.XXX_76639_77199_1 [CDS] Oithona nana genome sequencing.
MTQKLLTTKMIRVMSTTMMRRWPTKMIRVMSMTMMRRWTMMFWMMSKWGMVIMMMVTWRIITMIVFFFRYIPRSMIWFQSGCMVMEWCRSHWCTISIDVWFGRWSTILVGSRYSRVNVMALDFMRFKMCWGIIRVIIFVVIIIIISMVRIGRSRRQRIIMMRSSRWPCGEIWFGCWFGIVIMFFFI